MESSSHSQTNQWIYSSSESELYSVSSPDTVSTDQGFSPSHRTQPACSKSAKSTCVDKRKRRLIRLKNPSEQRQNASEKEKLRMRDLTKALHHLRTYLPPSVAPVGQTLTKIETLRLTIGYISFLSAQLGLSAEELKHNSSGCSCSPEIVGYFQCRSMAGHCVGDGQYEGKPSHTVDQYPQQHSAEQNVSANGDGFVQSQQCAQSTQTYQVYGRNLGYHLVPQGNWS
ncbi:mesoderm posterior ba [Pimephales promelas]|uniref:mesoderm posterior ba n=1 Tax=Pimephales promelas TaxID=90988 RepID=UPI001955D478|nr:mesoderm posterior ba [Pimephales promelas]KAG1959453.1 pancreas transcription factor 1 subunit alpha [Pimephales promelas]